MNRLGKHIINKVDANVFCGKKDLPKVQRVGIASCIKNSLEAISSYWDEHYLGETIRIEELSISLELQADELPNITELIISSLKEACEYLGHSKPRNEDVLFKGAVQRSNEEVFLHFVESGQMPWFSDKLEYKKINFQQPAFISRLLALMRYENARERVAQQLPKDKLQDVIGALSTPQFSEAFFWFIATVRSKANSYSKRFAAGHRISQKSIFEALKYLSEEPANLNITEFFSFLWPVFVPKIKEECNGQHRAFLEDLQDLISQKLGLKTSFFAERREAMVYPSKIKAPSKLEGFTNTPKPSELGLSLSQNEEHYALVNAGTILLYPFIKTLFKKVGLLENDQFISLEHQQRGVCLLHNLATGSLEFPEENLQFPKFLCNYPLEKSVPRDLPLSNYELEEVGTVLNTCLQHWEAVKNTSIEGLRVNFLQRRGLLIKENTGYTLHIEVETADILLDKLPWGITAVFFPWLADVLTIKWR